MAKHRVNWHLDMGKKQHREGDEVELNDEQSATLTKLGVVTKLEEDEESSEAGSLTPSQLSKLNKDELAKYAKDTFGAELNPADQTKDAMLAAIAVCAAAAEAK
jgi:hypothetical protein